MTRFLSLMGFRLSPAADHGEGARRRTEACGRRVEGARPGRGGRDRERERRARMIRFAHHLDLMSTGHLSGAEVELLEAAGVGSVAELAVRSPGELRARMGEANETLRVVAVVPSLCRVRALVLRAALRAGDAES